MRMEASIRLAFERRGTDGRVAQISVNRPQFRSKIRIDFVSPALYSLPMRDSGFRKTLETALNSAMS
jgi:hypothetical protein